MQVLQVWVRLGLGSVINFSRNNFWNSSEGNYDEYFLFFFSFSLNSTGLGFSWNLALKIEITKCNHCTVRKNSSKAQVATLVGSASSSFQLIKVGEPCYPPRKMATVKRNVYSAASRAPTVLRISFCMPPSRLECGREEKFQRGLHHL